MHSFRSAARMCRRPSCQGPASATLSFSYETAEVLLFDLVEERHPSRWDLCRTHADTLGVPRGWNLIDDRDAATPPPAADPEPVGAHTPADSGRRNRYAELSARLPELAGQHGSAAPAAERSGTSHGEAGDPEDAGTGRPSPRGPSTGARDEGALGRHRHGLPDVLVDERIPGQLSMTLPDTAGETDAVWGYAGNVVPLLRRESVLGSVT